MLECRPLLFGWGGGGALHTPLGQLCDLAFWVAEEQTVSLPKLGSFLSRRRREKNSTNKPQTLEGHVPFSKRARSMERAKYCV